MAVKTVDRTFLQGQSADLFRAAIKSQATLDPYERRLIGFLKNMDAESPEAFVEFAKSNPALAENRDPFDNVGPSEETSIPLAAIAIERRTWVLLKLILLLTMIFAGYLVMLHLIPPFE